MEIIHLKYLSHVHLFALINLVTVLIGYSNLAVWLFPPLKQCKGGFFYYFLILAFMDPLVMTGYALFKMNMFYVYAPSSFILFLSALYYTRSLSKQTLIYCLIIIFALLFLPASKSFLYITVFLHFIIFLCFLVVFIRKFFLRNLFYLYFIILIFYQFSIVVKLLLYIFGSRTGIFFLNFLNVLDVLVGFYFIIYNLQNSYKYHLKHYY